MNEYGLMIYSLLKKIRYRSVECTNKWKEIDKYKIDGIYKISSHLNYAL